VAVQLSLSLYFCTKKWKFISRNVFQHYRSHTDRTSFTNSFQIINTKCVSHILHANTALTLRKDISKLVKSLNKII